MLSTHWLLSFIVLCIGVFLCILLDFNEELLTAHMGNEKQLGYAITSFRLVQNRFSSLANRHFECCPCKALETAAEALLKLMNFILMDG